MTNSHQTDKILSPLKITQTPSTSPLFLLEPQPKNSQLFQIQVQVTFGSTQVPVTLLLAGTIVPTMLRNHQPTLLMDKHSTLPMDLAPSVDTSQEILPPSVMLPQPTSASVKFFQFQELLSTLQKCQESWVLPTEVSLLTNYQPSLIQVVSPTRVSPSISMIWPKKVTWPSQALKTKLSSDLCNTTTSRNNNTGLLASPPCNRVARQRSICQTTTQSSTQAPQSSLAHKNWLTNWPKVSLSTDYARALKIYQTSPSPLTTSTTLWPTRTMFFKSQPVTLSTNVFWVLWDQCSHPVSTI